LENVYIRLPTTFFFGEVVEPGVIPPIQNPLPLSLNASQIGISAMRLDGFSNELCFRLRDQYDQGILALDIKNGTAAMSLFNFQVILSFEMLNYTVSATPASCS